VNLAESIPMDDPRQLPKLVEYGKQMGRMILNDRMDGAMGVTPPRAPSRKAIPL
jgi:hypothetical protein